MTRSDGDTWDPVTGVGMTATFGAAARAVASNRGLIDDPANIRRYFTATRV